MPEIKNAIVAMFDSWQFNYAGCYGNTWIKTPNFDRFAREGVLFENAYANNLPTLPSRRSMMTGRYTLHEIGWAPLRPVDTTIADLCWGTGVDTAIAYNSYPLFVNKAGFARSYSRATYSRGYDPYHFKTLPRYDHFSEDGPLSDPGFLDRMRALPDGAGQEAMVRKLTDLYLRDKPKWTTDDHHTVAVNIHEAMRLLETADRNHGLMLWIDSWDPHEPWDPPSVWTDKKCPYDPDYEGADMWITSMGTVKDLYTPEQLRHIRALYAEKVSLCDKYFGELCACIDRLGLWNNTLLWLTADHGQPMGEGADGHGVLSKSRPWPYEETVHVPLIIKAPGLPANVRLKAFAQDCDCAPTLLDWLGIPIPPTMTGKSLLPLMRGEVDKVRDFAIAGFYNFSWSIITEDWTLIHWLNKLSIDDNDAVLKTIYTGLLEKDAISAKKQDMEDTLALTGDDQWTCASVGASVDVPEGDELFDRKADPFQLHNIIDKHPDVARRLWGQLRDFMADLPVIG